MSEAIDVIAQWNYDGTITPRRIQVHTEDGPDVYTIKSYRLLDHHGEMVHGKYVTADTLVWECSIVVLNVRKLVYLFFDGRRWEMAV